MSKNKLSDTSHTICCKHFTNSNMLNPSAEYKYANSAGMNGCSASSRFSPSHSQTVFRCEYPDRQSICPMFSPDFRTVKEASVSGVTYFLNSYRLVNGSYLYKIIDSENNTYFDFSYDNLSSKEYDLDQETEMLFDEFLSSFQEKINYSDSKSSEFQEEKKKNSYLLALIS